MRFSVHVRPDSQHRHESKNAQSLVLMIEYQDFTAIFTGDADSERREKVP
jgi:beta-lactamase superfamily II metal-dependent hydrolase